MDVPNSRFSVMELLNQLIDPFVWLIGFGNRALSVPWPAFPFVANQLLSPKLQ
jgi:hypothetical protein